MLTKQHLNTIAEASFDWLIGDHKVAPKNLFNDNPFIAR